MKSKSPKLVTSPVPCFITTDCHRSEPDDFQSLVHLLMCQPWIDIKGISVGYPKGDLELVRKLIRAYKKDLDKVKHRCLLPGVLRLHTYQGSTAPDYQKSTPGSRALVIAAKKFTPDTPPLHVLCWGAATDIAAALHVAPEIKPFVKVLLSGDWNYEQDKGSWEYVLDSGVWLIDSRITHKGMYTGWSQKNNKAYMLALSKCGHMGKLMYELSAETSLGSYCFKAGDTATTLFAMTGGFEDPTENTWGGSYRKEDMDYYCDREQGAAYSVARYRSIWKKHFRELMERLK